MEEQVAVLEAAGYVVAFLPQGLQHIQVVVVLELAIVVEAVETALAVPDMAGFEMSYAVHVEANVSWEVVYAAAAAARVVGTERKAEHVVQRAVMLVLGWEAAVLIHIGMGQRTCARSYLTKERLSGWRFGVFDLPLAEAAAADGSRLSSSEVFAAVEVPSPGAEGGPEVVLA